MNFLQHFLFVFILQIPFVSSIAHPNDKSLNPTNMPTTSDSCIKTCPTGNTTTQVCGSDGITYETKCHYEIVNCKSGGTISIKSTSKCSDSSCPITVCTTEISEICGSDGKTYTNECELKKVQCTNPNISIASSDKCIITPPPTFRSNDELDTRASSSIDTSHSNAISLSDTESMPSSHSGSLTSEFSANSTSTPGDDEINAIGVRDAESMPSSNSGSSTSEFSAKSTSTPGDDEISSSGSTDVIISQHQNSDFPFTAFFIVLVGIIITHNILCWLCHKKLNRDSCYHPMPTNDQTCRNTITAADQVSANGLSELKRGSIDGRKSIDIRLSESGSRYNGIRGSSHLPRLSQIRSVESPGMDQSRIRLTL